METKFTGCPEAGCDAPATVEEEMWASTTGGMMMAKVIGTCGHGFLMPAWKLDVGRVAFVDDLSGDVVAH